MISRTTQKFRKALTRLPPRIQRQAKEAYDESAAKSNYVRVIDNEGEDYLYPAKYFMSLDLPQEIERVLSRARDLPSSDFRVA